LELSKEVKIILSMCWEKDERRSTNFLIDEKYEWKEEKYKPTENTYEELVKYQQVGDRPIKIYRNGKYVNITGGTIIK